jgi:hypothetical protein
MEDRHAGHPDDVRIFAVQEVQIKGRESDQNYSNAKHRLIMPLTN